MQTILFTRDDMATASVRERKTKKGNTVFVAYLPCGETDLPEVFQTLEPAVQFVKASGFQPK